MMVVNRALLLVSLMSLCLTAFADTSRLRNGLQISGMFDGGTSRYLRVRTERGIEEFDIVRAFDSRMPRAANLSFGPEQERFIREWFSKQVSQHQLPEALATHESLPPGLELERNHTLPADLKQRLQPLPLALEHQLPGISGDVSRVVVAGNVLLLEESTARIVDLIRDVF
jgi:hypothetical protein